MAVTPDLERFARQDARYVSGGVLGRGGMGEVRSTLDARLDRQVAMKIALDPSLEQRLLREAALGARLDHPGILPVLDAGRLPDGRVFYTMPLVMGSTLADLIQGHPDLLERLRLVRPVLDACAAIDHAHQRGVLHLDVKPANLLVGALGATRVADWGMAQTREEARRARRRGGTPGFAPPEQFRTAAVDERADVFGLGATLATVLTGTHPCRPLLVYCPQAPPELAAIVDRATDPNPELRYPSAAALAEDLDAWLNGRQVSAYRYRPLEVLRRAIAANAVVVLLVAIGLVATVAALSFGLTQARQERDRALQAERRAAAAGQLAEANLGRALVARARAASEAGQRAEAEILALESLRRSPSDQALGLLTAWLDRPRPERLSVMKVPATPRHAVNAAGTLTVRQHEDRVELLQVGDYQATPLQQWDFSAQFTAFAGDRLLAISRENEVWSLYPEQRREENDVGPNARFTPSPDPGRLGLHWASSGQVIHPGQAPSPTRTCEDRRGPNQIAIPEVGPWWMVCYDGLAIREDGRQLRLFAPLDGVPSRARVNPSWLVVGLTDGRLLAADLERGDVRTVATGLSTLQDVSLRGDLVLFGDLTGSTTVLSLVGDLPPVRLPTPPGPALLLPDGGLLATGPDQIERWSLAPFLPPHRVQVHQGVSAVHFAQDDQLLIGDGDGHLYQLQPSTGRLEVLRSDLGTVKAIQHRADGLYVTDAAHSRLLRLGDQPKDDAVVQTIGHRRITALNDDQLLAAAFDNRITLIGAEGPRSFPLPRMLVDLEADPVSGEVRAVDNGEQVWAGRGVDLRPLATVPGAASVAPAGDRTVVAGLGGARLLDAEGRLLARLEDPAEVPVVARVAADGDLLVLGHLSGVVTLWSLSQQRRIAVLEGHTSRVSSVSFSPDQRWLATGSWDHEVRLWSLRALEVDLAAELPRLEASWGRGLEDLLGG